MALSFRSAQRLLTAADYRSVFSNPDFKTGQKEVLLLAKASEGPNHRLGLAVAKKHVPTAVKRNLIKRLARERFRSMPESSPSLDIVVLTRPAARDAERVDLRLALDHQFNRLHAKASRS